MKLAALMVMVGCSSSFDVGKDPVALTTLDIDNDGKRDLAVLDSAGTIALLFNTGDADFADPQLLPVAVGDTAIATLRWNGDRYEDLVTCGAEPNSQMRLQLNQAGGGFSWTVTPLAQLANDGCEQVIIGADEPVVETGHSVIQQLGNLPFSIAYATNLAAGHFDSSTTSEFAFVKPDGAVDWVNFGFEEPLFATGLYVPGATAIASGALDDNGLDDVAVASPGAIQLAYMKSEPALGPRIEIGSSSMGLAIRDMDGDGVVDIVSVNTDASVVILRSTGTDYELHRIPLQHAPVAFVVDDLDGNAHPDLAVLEADGNVTILRDPL